MSVSCWLLWRLQSVLNYMMTSQSLRIIKSPFLIYDEWTSEWMGWSSTGVDVFWTRSLSQQTLWCWSFSPLISVFVCSRSPENRVSPRMLHLSELPGVHRWWRHVCSGGAIQTLLVSLHTVHMTHGSRSCSWACALWVISMCCCVDVMFIFIRAITNVSH